MIQALIHSMMGKVEESALTTDSMHRTCVLEATYIDTTDVYGALGFEQKVVCERTESDRIHGRLEVSIRVPSNSIHPECAFFCSNSPKICRTT
jgi:hypothetical protein